MLNFAVGPVKAGSETLQIGGEQVPYFRTEEFSALMLDNEKYIKALTVAPEDSRAVFLTASGTAGMEAAVINLFSEKDRLLAVNGGSFGQRFVDICNYHNIPCDAVLLEPGKALREEDLAPYNGKSYTGFLVNLHETSTGVLYPAELIGSFCRKNGLILVVDAISAFLADPLNMSTMGADVVITSSQKALACPPGISVLVLSPRALERIASHQSACMYLDLQKALKDGERGQTPYTPAVGILRQLNARFHQIAAQGGADAEIARIKAQAEDFRQKVRDLPFCQFSEAPSNAVTALCPKQGSAKEIFKALKDQYNIWVCPNGGALAERLFRVGHMGALTAEDNTALVAAFIELQKSGILRG